MSKSNALRIIKRQARNEETRRIKQISEAYGQLEVRTERRAATRVRV